MILSPFSLFLLLSAAICWGTSWYYTRSFLPYMSIPGAKKLEAAGKPLAVATEIISEWPRLLAIWAIGIWLLHVFRVV